MGAGTHVERIRVAGCWVRCCRAGRRVAADGLATWFHQRRSDLRERRRAAQLIDTTEKTQDGRKASELFQSVAGFAAPVGSLPGGSWHILGLGLKPQVLEVDQHERGRAAC